MNQVRFANVMSRVLNVALWAHPTKALVFYNALSGRFGTGAVELGSGLPDLDRILALRAKDPVQGRVEASRFEGAWVESQDQRGKVEPFRLTRDGVGVITVTGSLINRGAWVGSYSGETSYEGIKHQLSRAAADSRVKSVILDMETPGGEAVGAMEASHQVKALSKIKPVIAVVNGMAASAGYALASGASEIVVTPSGISGSIGTVMLHLDYSEALAAEGIAPTLIYAGSHKVDGNSLEPLTKEASAELQSEVNRFYDLFIGTVAGNRGRRTTAKNAKDTEARSYIGKTAIDARIADQVGTFEEVLSELTSRAKGAAKSASATRRADMTLNLGNVEATEQEQAQAQADAAESKAAVTAAREEGRKAGAIEGAAAERVRLLAILDHAECAGREAFAMRLALEAPTMSQESMSRILQTQPRQSEQRAAPPSVSERERETGAAAVNSRPGAAQNGGNPPANAAGDAGWDNAVSAVNERTLAQFPRRAR